MATMATERNGSRPWYREPWPWLLMAGPALVVMAGFYTLFLAVQSSDGLVSENYYQDGLRVGETIARSENAARLGLTARLQLNHREALLRLVAKDEGFSPPIRLDLTLSHPTRAGLDRKSVFRREGEIYRGMIELPASGHWLVIIEDEDRRWRLVGSVMLPAAEEVVIGEK